MHIQTTKFLQIVNLSLKISITCVKITNCSEYSFYAKSKHNIICYSKSQNSININFYVNSHDNICSICVIIQNINSIDIQIPKSQNSHNLYKTKKFF